MKTYDLILLDRDGVINQDAEGYISDPDKWHPFPGSLEAIAQLNQAQKIVGVISNQSGIGRGLITEPQLAAVHEKMRNALAEHNAKIDGIFYCPHHPKDKCRCRKPKPYLLEEAQKTFSIPAEKTLVIGDSACDLLAAQTFGCDAHLVLTGNGKTTLANLENPQQHPVHTDLASAVAHLLGKQ